MGIEALPEQSPHWRRLTNLGELALRPMVRARRIAIFEREVREHLSKAALEALIGRGTLLSEGQKSTRGHRCFYTGSTMLTIDLESAHDDFREPPDAATARRLAALIVADKSARARLRAIAIREAEAKTRCKLHEIAVDLKVCAKGARVLIDLDVEAAL